MLRFILLLLTIATGALSLQPVQPHQSRQPPQTSQHAVRQLAASNYSFSSASRRNLLTLPFVAVGVTAGSANALDMDYFMNQELAAPSSTASSAAKSKMSDDEALCKFGQPSKGRGDACVRAGMSTKLKKGGVDAYGNVDRGDFVRCSFQYVEDPNSPNKGFLKKVSVCK